MLHGSAVTIVRSLNDIHHFTNTDVVVLLVQSCSGTRRHHFTLNFLVRNVSGLAILAENGESFATNVSDHAYISVGELQ